MAGGYPLGSELCNCTGYGVVLTTTGMGGTTVSAPGTANTKSSWVQLTAATTADADMIEITIGNTGAVATQANAVDIGIGAGGSEIVVFNNLMGTVQGQFTRSVASYIFPCSIPKGTRIAARSQSQTATDTGIRVSVRTFQSGFQNPGGAYGVDALGFSAAATTGTAVTAGNGAYGAWAQIIAATTRDYAGVVVAVDSTSANDSVFLFDVGVGLSGSEQVVASALIRSTSGGAVGPTEFVPVPIPAGSRVAVRGDDCISGSGHPFNATVYGIYY